MSLDCWEIRVEPLDGFGQGVAGGVVGDGGLTVWREAVELGAAAGFTVHGLLRIRASEFCFIHIQ